MSLEKKFAIEFILVFVLIGAIIGVGYFSFNILTVVYSYNVGSVFFITISVVLSLIYSAIERKCDSKII